MIATLCAWALAAGLAGAPADTLRLDLSDCLARAQAAAPRLAEALAVEAQAQAAADEAKARRLPVLGFGASYRYTSEVMEQSFTFGPVNNTLRFGDGHAADLNLGIAAPVFTGGELSGQARAAALGIAVAEQRTAATTLDLARDVRASFYASLGRAAQADAARLAVTRLQRHVAEIAAAVAAGGATEESRLRALERLRQAEQRERRATASQDSARIALGRLVGRPAPGVAPVGDLDATLLVDRDVSSARVAERPDLASLAREEERQAQLATALRGRLLPRIGADVRAHYGRPGVDLIANDWTPYATAAVSVDWPLWDAGARTSAAAQAAARARQTAARRDDVADALAAAHDAAQVELDAALAAQDLASERVALTERILGMVAGRLAAAAATESEYLDTQDDAAAAQMDLALARTRVRLAEITLLWTVGE